jgi:AraC-like DNA-binding protein
MHEVPSTPWTIQTLAERAGISRTAFALKFKAVVGSSVIDYLSRWRMVLASDRLRHTEDSISEIAFSLGYQSESAFSKAFKRIMGSSPRQCALSIAPTPAIFGKALVLKHRHSRRPAGLFLAIDHGQQALQ